jgi:hypothetical protein
VRFLEKQLDEEREANRENRRIIAGLVHSVPELERGRESTPESPESPETASEEPIVPTPLPGGGHRSPHSAARGDWAFFSGP